MKTHEISAEIKAELTATLATYQGGHAVEMRSITERLVTVLKYTVNESDKIAKEASRDAKAILKLAGNSKLIVGKASKDGQVSIKESCSGKGAGTPALSIVHALQWMADAGKHGIAYGWTMWRLKEELDVYIRTGVLPDAVGE